MCSHTVIDTAQQRDVQGNGVGLPTPPKHGHPQEAIVINLYDLGYVIDETKKPYLGLKDNFRSSPPPE